MTIIAYRDGIMAADKQGTFGEAKKNDAVKVFSNDRWVVGFGGYPRSLRPFLEDVFACEGDTPPKLSDFFNDKDTFGAYALCVNRKTKKVFRYDGCGFPYEELGEYNAAGSGMDCALGAMFVGASAIEAVRAAIAHNTGCGGDVDSIHI